MGKLEEIVFKLIDKEISGVDIYHKSGSMWLIFTDKKKWVVEYTDSNILWYNFSFFNYALSLVGLSDEKEKYVKKWFESKFIFKPKIEEIHHVDVMKFFNNKMNDTIQNGVKHIKKSNSPKFFSIDDTIQNGVKSIQVNHYSKNFRVEGIIQDGVKCDLLQNYLESEIKIIS